MSTAEGWSETIPVNISVAFEDANVSEDLLEDDNESTELDGNLSDAKLASVRLKTKCYPRRHRVGSAGLRREACWEGMVSEVPKIEHELIGEFIRHSIQGPKTTRRRCRTAAAWTILDSSSRGFRCAPRSRMLISQQKHMSGSVGRCRSCLLASRSGVTVV